MKNQNQITYMKTGDVARLFGISNQTVLNYVQRGILPAPSILGNSRRWDSVEITEIFNNQFNKKGDHDVK